MIKYSPEAWSDYKSHTTHAMQEWIEINNITPDTILTFKLTNYAIVHIPSRPNYEALALKPIPYSSRVLYFDIDDLKFLRVNTELTLEILTEKENSSIKEYLHGLLEERKRFKIKMTL